MSRLAEGPVTPAPRLGQHTDELLKSVLALGDDEIAALRAQGAIG
jgi:crotonobetainyl-CoA:carnitine CoA-transferase CaiB-like acyl-CoA transferase